MLRGLMRQAYQLLLAGGGGVAPEGGAPGGAPGGGGGGVEVGAGCGAGVAGTCSQPTGHWVT
jgi:hypothetical protein